jgi:hypothetical protein
MRRYFEKLTAKDAFPWHRSILPIHGYGSDFAGLLMSAATLQPCNPSHATAWLTFWEKIVLGKAALAGNGRRNLVARRDGDDRNAAKDHRQQTPLPT